MKVEELKIGGLYRFKGMKHSVVMVLKGHDQYGLCVLENKDYKGLVYKKKCEKLEEVK